MMSSLYGEAVVKAQHKVGQFIMSRTGINFMELPDNVVISDWIHDEMTENEIDEIVPDIAWEILDLSGMDRDAVDRICYPDEFEEADNG
tara:strand:- start:72 stop:338 length:267 start_codon:yes stop_codon:yes gene_type:complete